MWEILTKYIQYVSVVEQYRQYSEQATGWATEELWVDSGCQQHIFLFITTSWPAPAPIQPPFNGYQLLLPQGLSGWGRADPSAPSSTEIKNEWRCTSTFPYAFMACTETAGVVSYFNEEDCQNHIQYWSVWVISSKTGCNDFSIDTNI